MALFFRRDRFHVGSGMSMEDAQQLAQEHLHRVRQSRLPGSCGKQTRQVFISRPLGERPNFGDELNVDLAKTMLDLQDVRLSDTSQLKVATPKVLAIGSILGFVRNGDVVVGAGAKHRARDNQLHMDSLAKESLRSGTVKVLAVRGPHTCEVLEQHMDLDCPRNFGDPALIAGLLLPQFAELARNRQRNATALCVVPHAKDSSIRAEASQLKEFADADLRILSTDHIDASDLAPCAAVAASALHGIIIADALRIPSIWLGIYEPPSKARAPIHANQPPFKYLDYFAGVLPAGRSPPTPLKNVQAALHAFSQEPEPTFLARPRLSVHFLLNFTLRYIDIFPFEFLCR